MPVSFGGVYLTDPADLAAQGLLPQPEMCEPLTPGWPGKNREAWAANASSAPRWVVPAGEFGQLVWPTGASRCAVYRGLATEAQLASIRKLVYGSTNTTYTAQSFVMDDQRTGRKITTSLYPLPAVPLKQRSGASGLYALLLVDIRYFWAEVAASIVVTGGTTTWANLFTAIASALGVSITTDSISANYVLPDVSLTGRYENVPQLLDAVCLNVGHRFVRLLDGTCKTQTFSTAKTSQEAQVASWTSIEGGALAFVASTKPNDLNSIAPQSVTVLFPRSDSGVPNLTTPYALNTTLAGLALAEYSGAVGHSGIKVFKDTATAYYVSNAIQNGTELTNLASQIATDFYRWRLSRNLVTYAGIVPYVIEGLSDRVLWTQRGGECSTRLARGPWDDRLEEQNHLGATYGSIDRCCDGDSVSNSITNVSTNYLTNALVVAPSDSSQANFKIQPPTGSTQDIFDFYKAGDPSTKLISAGYQGDITDTPASGFTGKTLTINKPGDPATPVLQGDYQGQFVFQTSDPGKTSIIVKQPTGTPTVESLVVEDSSGGKEVTVDKNGYLTLYKTGTPPDASFDTGSFKWYIDTTSGTPKVLGKVKDSGGNYYTVSINIDNSSGSIGGSGMTNPMTTLGDIIYEDATPTPARLAGNTSATKKFLQQTGTGSVSAAPAWDVIALTDLPSGSGGNGVGTFSEGSIAAAGSSQGTATTITSDRQTVTGADNTKGVILPSTTGALIVVTNSDATHTLKVYPPSGAAISSLGTNNPDTLSGVQTKMYIRVTSTQWRQVAVS